MRRILWPLRIAVELLAAVLLAVWFTACGGWSDDPERAVEADSRGCWPRDVVWRGGRWTAR